MDGDDFDVRLQPVTFAELLRRLDEFSISRDEKFDGDGAYILRLWRMGLGTDQFYPVSAQHADEMILPPTLEALIRYFEISVEEWAAAADIDLREVD